MASEHETSPEEASDLGTGEVPYPETGGEPVLTKVCSFGPYEVVVRLNVDGRFLDVLEVRVNREFRSVAQKMAASHSYDVTDLYED